MTHTTDWKLMPNRYAGVCADCRKAVAAGTGFYSRERRALVCSATLDDQGRCPSPTAAAPTAPKVAQAPTVIPITQEERDAKDDMVEHAKGERVRSVFTGDVGTVIAVCRKKKLSWTEKEHNRISRERSAWVGQQLVIVRWANGREGGVAADKDSSIRWWPANMFYKMPQQRDLTAGDPRRTVVIEETQP